MPNPPRRGLIFLMAWYLYLLECENGSIYTGIAVDVEERFKKHLSGKGARYTRANPPKKILATMKYRNRSLASKAEYATKCLSAEEKRSLCAAWRSREKKKKKKLNKTTKNTRPRTKPQAASREARRTSAVGASQRP